MIEKSTPGGNIAVCFSDSCMIDNIVYGGYDIRDFNVANNYECQYFCQAEPACNFFMVLKSGTGQNNGVPHCWLKYFYGQTNWHPDYMGGTRNCNQFKGLAHRYKDRVPYFPYSY